MGQGWFWLVILIVLFASIASALIGLTIVGAARAWRNEDVGWVAVILGAWVLGMGWGAALFYLVAIDAKRQMQAGPPGSPTSGTVS
jgi:hypothetical protein